MTHPSINRSFISRFTDVPVVLHGFESSGNVSTMKITHATSVHPRTDIRIWVKMCRSVAAAGHEVTLVVADGLGNEERDGTKVLDVAEGSEAAQRGRLHRATRVARRVMKAALDTDADVVHFHDPELLPHAAWLRKQNGPRLIFDAHEDVPKQILGKHYLPRMGRPLASAGYAGLEGKLISRVDAVVTATPSIADRYRKIHSNVLCVANFPWRDELVTPDPGERDRFGVCYVGGISPGRGVVEMVSALEHTETAVPLFLAGPVPSENLKDTLSKSRGWQRVTELGFLDRAGVRGLLAKVAAGLVTLRGTPAYMEAYPTKMFEYMSARVPVIASDFPLWKRFVEGEHCGLCIDPTEPREIASAIDRLVANPEEARAMGNNGRAAVEREYNWESQASRLLQLYQSSEAQVRL
jgi:glycosyltransferase involved in cell wall biosynthesis